jgi:uncharacterized protein
MNKPTLPVIVLLAISLASASAQIYQPPPQINVSGSAEVKVVPDEVMLDVAVDTRAGTLEPARLENDRNVAAALAFLEQSGLPDKDVKTDFICVQPCYDNSVSYVKPVAYMVGKSIEIRLTDIANFQNVLTGLLTNGVNVVNDVDFRTTQLRKYRDQARAMAIRAAKEKAVALTGELGTKLGKPTSISTYDNSSYYGNYWGGNRGFFNGYNNAFQNQNSFAGGGGSGGAGGGNSDTTEETFAIGQISVTATVNVSFLIE